MTMAPDEDVRDEALKRVWRVLSRLHYVKQNNWFELREAVHALEEAFDKLFIAGGLHALSEFSERCREDNRDVGVIFSEQLIETQKKWKEEDA